VKLIVGLGNPGEKYENTRHNAGFKAIDEFARKIGAPEFAEKPKWESAVSQFNHDAFGDLILMKPLTFMNESGRAVANVGGFYKIPTENIWVLYDDVDLALGQIRIRDGGGAGTHNGMKSLIEHLGTGNFPRFRIGIESRGQEGSLPTEADLHAFVLGAFNEDESKAFNNSLSKACEALEAALKGGIGEAANGFNG
jgi:peptidyl-tRNA hydrolase, PTH1 family